MMQHTLAYLHLLAIAVLVGKVVFFSFVTAPILARTLDPVSFARVVRQLFPQYYVLGMISAVVGWATITALGVQRGFGPFDLVSSALWLGVLTIENYCRTPLTPQINELSDQLKENLERGLNTPLIQKRRDSLHRLTVQLNSAVLVMGLCLIGLIESPITLERIGACHEMSFCNLKKLRSGNSVISQHDRLDSDCGLSALSSFRWC